MTTDLTMPTNVPNSDPASPMPIRNFSFDHIPGLKELLPKHAGRPGFEYLQCTVANLRRAQDEQWTEVENTMIYTIVGPKGEAHMKLLARGKPIPGQSPNSGARLCQCDKTVQELTGVWINPHKHQESEIVRAEEGGDTPTSVEDKTEDND